MFTASKNAALLFTVGFLFFVSYTDASQSQEPITYAHYYLNADTRPNTCKIFHNTSKKQYSNNTNYVPFIGTSIARDSQLLVLRLFYSSLDFPVKYFVVVVPERALEPPRGGMWYELEHLKDYAENVVIITCTNPPSVAEGWNAGKFVQHRQQWQHNTAARLQCSALGTDDEQSCSWPTSFFCRPGVRACGPPGAVTQLKS
jgi:hypothetical protein